MEFKVGDIVKLRDDKEFYALDIYPKIPRSPLYVVHVIETERYSSVVLLLPGKYIHLVYFSPDSLKKIGELERSELEKWLNEDPDLEDLEKDSYVLLVTKDLYEGSLGIVVSVEGEQKISVLTTTGETYVGLGDLKILNELN